MVSVGVKTWKSSALSAEGTKLVALKSMQSPELARKNSGSGRRVRVDASMMSLTSFSSTAMRPCGSNQPCLL